MTSHGGHGRGGHGHGRGYKRGVHRRQGLLRECASLYKRDNITGEEQPCDNESDKTINKTISK